MIGPLELVFESLTLSSAVSALNQLILASDKAEDVGANCSSVRIEGEIVDSASLRQYLKSEPDAVISVRLLDCRMDRIFLPLALIRVIGYDNRYEVELSFDIEAVLPKEPHDFLRNLQYYAQEFANKYQAETFYCGIEPALDEATRYFTNDVLGPLVP